MLIVRGVGIATAMVVIKCAPGIVSRARFDRKCNCLMPRAIHLGRWYTAGIIILRNGLSIGLAASDLELW